MNARALWFNGWLCVVVAVLLPQAASAQCLPDVFLAMGGSAPTAASVGWPPIPPGSPSDDGPTPVSGTPIVRLSEAELLALPVKVIVTATDWTPVSRFEGPLLRDVIKLRTGVPGALNVFALNQYAITIPMSDLDEFAPILAHTRDGVRMKRSDFGPLFIVYPRDRYAELRAPSMAARMAWQVCRIDVE